KQLIEKKYVHIGFAVDTPDGLLVPVIRDVDRKSLLELAAEAAALADKARNKKLSAHDMQGACFTISSLGHIGGTYFTPIVNTPEVAILGVSRATMQPVWDGKAFQPRLMLPLHLSYDHRTINAAAAAQFSRRLGELLGDIRSMLLKEMCSNQKGRQLSAFLLLAPLRNVELPENTALPGNAEPRER